MDSLSQAALGAAVVVATMGRRTAVWKAAAWGAVLGTLPDLDALIDHGDPIANMTLHRAESHALLWLTLASVPLAWLIAALQRDGPAGHALGAPAGPRVGPLASPTWRRWWLAVWLALITHPLLDAMTVYGTQLALPFTSHPYGVGSMFIIDPLYTLPLLVGVVWAMRSRGSARGLAANRWGLVLSCAYLAWSAVAQAWVRDQAHTALQAAGLAPERVLVTPAPLTTLLWRVVAVTPDGRYHEGFRALLDPADRPWRFDAFDQGRQWLPEAAGLAPITRILAFSHGFWKLSRGEQGLVVTDLRMGQEPGYVFAFEVPRAADGQAATPRQIGGRLDVGRGLRWLGPRILGEDLPPPR